MNTFIKKINVNIFITVIFFVFLGWYFLNNQAELQQLRAVPLRSVLLIAVLKFLGMFINGFYTKFILGSFDKNISIKETTFLAWITSIGNFFGPILGGASVRAVYLKKKFNFEYSKFISTLYGLYIVTFMVIAMIGFICSVLLAENQGSFNSLVSPMIVFFTITIVNLCLMVLPLKWITFFSSKIKFLPPRLQNILELIVDGWEVIRKDKILLVKLMLLNLIIFSISVAQTYILYGLFVDDYSILNVIIYTVLGSLSIIISFTPGAIGIKEAMLLFFAGAIALNPVQILQIAVIDRSITFINIFISFISVKVLRIDKKFV